MDVEHAIDVEPIKKPAASPIKQWRNWWRSEWWSIGIGWKCPVCQRTQIAWPLQVYGDHCIRWPSKDTAETNASERINANHVFAVKYLGAYPEGERP